MRTLLTLPVLSLALGAGLLACGAPPDRGGGGGSSDGGPGVDGGGSGDAGMSGDGGNPLADCGSTASPRHHSYVPCGEHPTSAARLIVMGDSISVGYGATPQSGPDDYVNLLVSNDNTLWPAESNTSLTALFGVGNVPIVSVAHAGDTTNNIAGDQLTNLSGALGASVTGHSIVVITIGGNDMFALVQQMSSTTIDSDIGNFVSNLRTAINYLQDPVRFPDGTSIYVANVYDPSDTSGVLPTACVGFPGSSITNIPLEMGVVSLAAAYVTLAKELGFSVVDALQHFYGHGLTAAMSSDPVYDSSDPVDWYYTDCIHPTNDGHNELRRLFFEAINTGHYVATDI